MEASAFSWDFLLSRICVSSFYDEPFSYLHQLIKIIFNVMGCTQIPISTLSHIWVFVRLYGIVFVIIVIIIIIIIIIKSEGVNAQL